MSAMPMERLFHLMAEKKASDLFISVGSPIHLKINGNAVPINQQMMDHAMVRSLLGEVLSEAEMTQLDRQHDLNTAVGIKGVGRFRISAFYQRGTAACVVRYVQNEIPPLASLKLPKVLSEIIMEKRGLVLMVGATGSGKSTTIASMLDHRNTQKAGHILTIEDPIEYTFTNRKSIVNQREIGTDTDALQVALKSALRQAPDCILIGEIRDKETMAAAIAYAQSGHLCMATLHANNSYHALNRIIGFYPIENRPALLSDLAAALKSIISQRLIRSLNGGRVAAVEVLLNTRHISELIDKGDINEIKDAMEKSLSPGSQTFEQALYRMLLAKEISEEEALINSDSPTNLLWLINNSPPPGSSADPVLEQEKNKEPEGASFTEFTLNT